MNVLLWIILGGVAGFIASLVTNTNRDQGMLLDIFFGMLGSVAGGFLMNTLGFAGVTGFNLYSFVVSIIGAIAVISIVKMLRRTL